ncbi:MAG: S41 family peptidase [Moraxella sp.]|nr:S41 family peptidase [Moraxella sp.]
MKRTKNLLFASIVAVLLTPSAMANLPETGDTDDISLSVLETKPNPLHDIEGLHQGRVPLNALSPNTLKTFVSVIDLVRREYVDETSDELLFKNAMSGMLTKLDRNAEFLDETAFNNLKSFTAGNIANVGISVVWQGAENHWVVSAVSDGSPAKSSGVMVGDYLHQIGETKLNSGQSVNDVVQLLSGIAGTQVDIMVSRAGRSKRVLTLQRTQTMKTNIETAMYDDVAVVKIPVFQNNTREQILGSLANANVPISGLILDIRNNPGGVLESAGAVASLFMKNQVVAKVEGRHGIEQVLSTDGSPLLSELPVMILQNRYSASASEVLSSSLQAQKRALIVGERSYGKGSVQSVIPIGDNQAVKLTTAHYLTAKDTKIDGVGVLPDVLFSNQVTTTRYFATQDDWLHQALVLMSGAKLPQGIKFDPVGGF